MSQHAMAYHEYDDWGMHLSDATAFSRGLRVTLEVMMHDEGSVVARPIKTGVTPFETVRCDFPTWALQYIDVGAVFTVLDFHCQCHDEIFTLRPKNDLLLPVLHPLPNACGMAEAFAGLGGWTLGATLFGTTPTLLVEKEPDVAMACAKSHGILCVSIDCAMGMMKAGELPDHLVLIASIDDPRVWFIASTMNITHWMASPPCPPWSNAAYQKGIDVEEGRVFIRFLYMLGVSHAVCATLENVPGIVKHPHFKYITETCREAGFKLLATMVDKASPLLPITRQRWLATCVREDIHVDTSMLFRARNMTIPSSVPGIGQETSMGSANVLQQQLQQWELDQVLPSAEALRIMSLPEYLPVNLRHQGYMKLTPNETIKLRIKSPRQMMPNVMALQGTQHNLPEALLRDKGLHAWLIAHEGRVRFVTPYEILSAMGMPHHMCLPRDFVKAWHAVGNSLSIAHAGLQCLRTKLLVGESSGLGGRIHDVFQLCDAIRDQMVCLDLFTVQVDDEWIYLASHQPIGVQPTIDILDSEEEDMPVHDFMVKRETTKDENNCISTTVPFCVVEPVPPIDHVAIVPKQDPELIPGIDPNRCDQVSPWSFATKAPLFGTHAIQCTKEEQSEHSDVIAVHIVHSQHNWTSLTHVPAGATVFAALHSILPHACENHFAEVFVGNQRTSLHDVLPAVSHCVVTFRPCSFPKVVSACFLELDQVIEVDVTWKCEDLLAYVATEAAILPTAIEITTDGKPCHKESFVLASEVTDYQADFIQIPKPFVHPPTPVGTWKRVTFLHPKWKSIRTAVFPDHVCIKQAISEMCGSSIDDQVTIHHHGTTYSSAVLLADCPSTMCNLSLKPEAEHTPIFIHEPALTAEKDCRTVSVWVKSPFAYRACLQELPAHWTLIHLVHNIVQSFHGLLTLMPTAGGSTIPSTMTMDHFGALQTIDIRVCPLQGGAKAVDPATKALRDMLLARGVSTDDVDSRIQMMKAKIPMPDIATMMSMSDQSAWAALKSKANQTGLRLITSAELKAHQKSLRQYDKPPKSFNTSATSSDKPPKKQRSVPSNLLKKISIDPKHFHANGQPVTLLEEAKWGPDMQGITVTTPELAQKRLPAARLSADYLALIVVTSAPFNNQQPISVPAQDSEGRPTLATIVIVNFGDIPVQCKPVIPSTDLQAVPTVIVEITIIRQYVVNWDDVRNIHNYLGHHLPELRKGQVIATWAFKPYDSKRVACDHKVASHLHGFIRIQEQGMHPTLARSGHAGIFMQLKGENKRPDSRYGVIILHGMKLEEALQLAAAHKQALGIVQLGSAATFALRARREHVSAIRQAIHPQSIAMQEGPIPTDATWWILRNVNVSTTCQDLTKALHSLGWQATVVRSAGKSAWICCSEADPPANHLCLGSDYVSVTPLLRQHAAGSNLPPAETYVPMQPNFSMCPEDDAGTTTPVSTSTRFTDLKVDLEDKLTEMINEKMRTCDAKIAQVATSVEGVRHELGAVIEHSKREFIELREQQTSIQTQIQTNNNGMLHQMQTLFKQMQQELKASLVPVDNDDDMEAKRARGS